MQKKNKKSLIYFIIEFILILSITTSVYISYSFISGQKKKCHLFEKIQKSGILNAAIVKYNPQKGYPGPPADYFINIAEIFASRLSLKIKFIYCNSFKKAEELVLQKKADILIVTNPVDLYKKTMLRYSKPYINVSWHLIVNRDNIEINSPEDIKNDKITLGFKNPAIPPLKKIQPQNSFKIDIVENISVMELFKNIQEGKITATAADNLTARTMRYFYPKASMTYEIKEKTNIGFGVHPEANELRFRINMFIDNIQDEEFIKILSEYYFHKLDVFDYLELRKFHRRIKDSLPEYIKMIKQYSKETGLDWRIVAAQIYQESHYNRNAKSNARAKGLMQLMHSTAKSLGVSNVYSPEENIKAGILYLKKLYDIFDKAEKKDRIKIALAAYNIGQGHIYDARKISRSLNLNPDKWHNMVLILPLLKKKEFHSETRYGYARGDEPVTYVRKIIAFYKILKVLYPEKDE